MTDPLPGDGPVSHDHEHGERCKVCRGPVDIQIRKGSGICSILCEKVDKGELPRSEAPDRG